MEEIFRDSICAFLALLLVQLTTTILVAVTKKAAIVYAPILLIYAIFWPLLGIIGRVAQWLGILCGLVISILQFECVVKSNSGFTVVILSTLAFAATMPTMFFMIPCFEAVENLHYDNNHRVRIHHSTTGRRPPTPMPIPVPAPMPHGLTPPPVAVTIKGHEWVTVVSPDNQINIGMK
jgi:hypothetical protein